MDPNRTRRQQNGTFVRYATRVNDMYVEAKVTKHFAWLPVKLCDEEIIWWSSYYTKRTIARDSGSYICIDYNFSEAQYAVYVLDGTIKEGKWIDETNNRND